MSNQIILNQADIFQELTPDQLDRIAQICVEKEYALGELIFEENAASDELYIIARGEVEIVVDPSLVSDRPSNESRPATIATLRRGQSFGEVALVDQGLRSAAARSAHEGTHLIIIPRDQLMALIDRDPGFGYILMRNLAADLALKIRNSSLMIREKLLYSPSEHE
ncbi:MAG: cyclic nucleotide-binding domain-containing protein [Anaerolineales bacterium]|jgi:CRP-like cAMP-binding protein